MTRIIEHTGDVAKTLDLARPFWIAGEAVEIKTADRLMTYFNFLLASSMKVDDVLEDMARFMLKRREMEKPYNVRLNKLSRIVSHKFDMHIDEVKRRFRDIRIAIEEDCTF